jgi:diguanylate cyclase (GGDEF)-like protein
MAVGTTEQMSIAPAHTVPPAHATPPAQIVPMPVRPESNGNAAPEPCKVTDILASIGEVPYEWNIASDALTWGANAWHVLKITDAAAIATNSAFAGLMCTGNIQSRRDAVLRSEQRDAGAGVPYQVQYSIHAAGETTPMWVEDTGRWFAGPDGQPVRAHGMVRVINERRAREERLSYLSRFDDLTGEMNRRQFTDVLADTLQDAIRFRTSFTMLVVSIDDLARINEAYGFAVGDDVISAVVLRLRASMRGTDGLGRLSGNKFGLILRECGADDLVLAAERLLLAVRDEVIHTRTGPVAVTASIGGIVAPRHAHTVHELLSRVHEALNAGKLRRRGTLEVFRPNVEREAMRRENMRASDAIIGALNERRIIPAFEPVVEAVSRRPAFHECLMRIGRPDGTLIAATDIMPIAERLGLVRLIDHRMLEIVIAELDEVPGLRLSVNVSPASTIDGTWWNALAASLAGKPGLAPRVTIELTESAAIQNLDETRAFVARVKDIGCRIAIDDFGTGCTSFRNMRRLGVDLVKIDGGFVKNLARSQDDQAFVRMLIGLAQQLGLKTVAEWVQDEACAALLTGWGCDYLQGALIGSATVERSWASPAAPGREACPAPATVL